MSILATPVESGELKVEISDNQGNIHKLVRTFAGIVSPPEDCDAQIAALQEQINSLQQQINNLQQQNASTTEELNQLKNKIGILKEKVVELFGN